MEIHSSFPQLHSPLGCRQVNRQLWSSVIGARIGRVGGHGAWVGRTSWCGGGKGCHREVPEAATWAVLRSLVKEGRKPRTKLHLPKSIHKQPPWPGSSLVHIPPSIHILNASSWYLHYSSMTFWKILFSDYTYMFSLQLNCKLLGPKDWVFFFLCPVQVFSKNYPAEDRHDSHKHPWA